MGREFNPHFGFLVGWAMTLDYLMIPLINTVFGSLTLYRLAPQIPYVVWVMLFVEIITFLNLRGVRAWPIGQIMTGQLHGEGESLYGLAGTPVRGSKHKIGASWEAIPLSHRG